MKNAIDLVSEIVRVDVWFELTNSLAKQKLLSVSLIGNVPCTSFGV